MGLNVQFVYGAGNDDLFGGALAQLHSEVKATFRDMIWCPRIIDHTEYNTLVRLLNQWKDPTILVGHSCGVRSITAAAAELSMEPIPYLLAIAPSIYCSPVPLPPNVLRATQATSWVGDFFNPLGRTIVRASPVNNKTKVDVISTGKGHLFAPGDKQVQNRLMQEISQALIVK